MSYQKTIEWSFCPFQRLENDLKKITNFQYLTVNCTEKQSTNCEKQSLPNAENCGQIIKVSTEIFIEAFPVLGHASVTD